MDKMKILQESKRHFKFKEDKIRQQVQEEILMQENLDSQEMQKILEKQEDLIFNLANEDFASCSKKFNYRVPEIETKRLEQKLNLEKVFDDQESGISCGQKVNNKVILRNVHDRLYSEPRGKTYLHMKQSFESTCLTHKQWLHEISNDSKITVSDFN